MPTIKKKEDCALIISKLLKSDFNITITTVKTVGELMKHENFVAVLKPCKKPIRISHRNF